MSRRRRNQGLPIDRILDSGKDIFGYLFLIITMFSFMLMMSIAPLSDKPSRQEAPQKHGRAGSSELVDVPESQIGRLVKKDDLIFLSYEGELYSPKHDMARLQMDNRISLQQKKTSKGTEVRKTIFLEETSGGKVLLYEYLNAFQAFNNAEITIAFAKRLR